MAREKGGAKAERGELPGKGADGSKGASAQTGSAGAAETGSPLLPMSLKAARAVAPTDAARSKVRRRAAWLRRQVQRGKLGGAACLEKHGVGHYRSMGMISAALRKGQKRTDRVRCEVKLSPRVMRALNELAEERGCSRAEVTRLLLAEYLKRVGRL